MSHPTRRPEVRRLVALLTVTGLMLGVLGALLYTSRPSGFRAHAVLAMLPEPAVQPADRPVAWQVLTEGQATRTAAIVLGQPHWLDGAARAAGSRPGDLVLAAGAIPQTTLIDVTVDAGSAPAAETALRAVLDAASPDAARVSGPFVLELVQAPSGSATPLAPPRLPVYLALALGGAAVGAGAGLLLARRRPAPADGVRVPGYVPERLGHPLASRDG